MKVVFFAGGVGTRLWPVSRKKTPKQFEKIVGDKSTLRLGIDRVSSIVQNDDIYISTGVDYKDIIYKQLPEIPKENIILEPAIRDVGAAVGLIAAVFSKIAPNDPFVILWSDHLVKNVDSFQKILKTGEKYLLRNPNKIIFLGQSSRFPSENLGWVEQGEKIESIDEINIYKFKSLHYRPDKKSAEMFHKSLNHTWNPGYFITTGKFLFSLYKKLAPEMAGNLDRVASSWGKSGFQNTLDKIYPKLEKNSFDNLILEKLGEDDALVIAADLGWSDIGAWEALKEALAKNKKDNVVMGRTVMKDTTDTIAYNYTDKLMVGIDLDGMIIVNTDDVVLICPKGSVPKIKKLVESFEGTKFEDLT